MRVVTGGTRLVSLLKLYAETGWEYLEDRREKHRLTYFYKMNNGLTPGYLIILRFSRDLNTLIEGQFFVLSGRRFQDRTV
jgi:hypothetical protein